MITEHGLRIETAFGGIKVTNIDTDTILHIVGTTDGFLIDCYKSEETRDYNIMPTLNEVGTVIVSNKKAEK